MTERLRLPLSYDDAPAAVAIAARLKPYLDSDVQHAVKVTYWREGTTMPLASWMLGSQYGVGLSLVARRAPFGATHVSIEGELS